MILGERVGRQISGAIDGSRLFAELKTTESDLARHAVERAEAATQSEAIPQIGKLLSSTLDIEEVYQPFVDEVRKLINCDVLATNLVEADRKMIRVIHQVGRQRDDRLVGSRLVLAGSITEAAATAGRPVIVQGYSEAEMAERFPLTLPSYRMGAKSWMCTPMINRGQTIGGLVFISNVKSAFSQSDADLAQRVGDQIAGAIANSKSLADLKQAEANLEVSYQRYQMILETSHDAFVAIDDRGQVITWNTQAEKTFGWKSGDAVRRRLSDLIIPPPVCRSAHGRLAQVPGHRKGQRREPTSGVGCDAQGRPRIPCGDNDLTPQIRGKLHVQRLRARHHRTEAVGTGSPPVHRNTGTGQPGTAAA